MENRNSIYAAAYARKILGLTMLDVYNIKRSKKPKSNVKLIKKHGNYNGTDVGFTSNTIEASDKQKKTERKQANKIDRNSNYDGTDAGFTSKF